MGNVVAKTLPAWLETSLFGMEVVGLVVGFISPFAFGIALPLLE